jgi:hypothetical protein
MTEPSSPTPYVTSSWTPTTRTPTHDAIDRIVHQLTETGRTCPPDERAALLAAITGDTDTARLVRGALQRGFDQADAELEAG